MVTNKTALKALLAHATDCAHRATLFHGVASDALRSFDQRTIDLMQSAYHGSLDAAKALHEAVLPGWPYCDMLRRGNRYTVHINKGIDETHQDCSAVSETPARAWLIAILKAMIAERT